MEPSRRNMRPELRTADEAGGICHGSNGRLKWHLTDGSYHSIMPFMNAIVTLDKAGRVVIPKTLRDELRLAPGDSLALETDGERMVLRPVRSASALRKEQGIWVFRGGIKLSAGDTDQLLDSLRQERDRKARGA